jgi:hypothetical protein
VTKPRGAALHGDPRRPHPRALSVGGEGLRLSTSEDAELITGWLADPRVHRWWGGEPVPLAEVRRKYTGARAPGVVVHLVLRDGEPVGLLQAWRDPDGSAGLGMFRAAHAQGRPGPGRGVDPFRLGDPHRRPRGGRRPGDRRLATGGFRAHGGAR